MSTLLGSLRNPSVADNPVSVAEIRQAGELKDVEVVRDTLARWKSWRTTREGVVAAALADPIITRLHAELRKGVLDYPSLTVDQIDRYHAECRGELRMWECVKYSPHMLEDVLKQIEQRGRKQAPKKGVPDTEKYV